MKLFGCENEESLNDSSDLNLISSWNVNLEIFEGSSGFNGTPDESLSGTLVFTENTIIASMIYMGYSYNSNFDDTLNSSSYEISMSVNNSLQTFTSCFSGNDTYGVCSTCGFYDSQEDAQGDYDCITCPERYEIDVFF